jgi:hypothetical protein
MWWFQLLFALSNKDLSALDRSTPPSPLAIRRARNGNKGVTPIRAFPHRERSVYSMFPCLTDEACMFPVDAYVP